MHGGDMNQKKDFFKTKVFVLTGFILLAIGIALSSNLVSAENNASPELIAEGRELFNTTKSLGNKFACILCHRKDKAIRRAEVAKLGDRLPDVINKYLVEKSKGKPLAKDSQEMKALTAYIVNEHSV